MKNKDNNKKAQTRLYQALLALKTAEETEIFLKDLCTPSEIEAMVDRWEVVDLLSQKKPYRTISEETGVSVTTVTRVARCLFAEESGYQKIYNRVSENEK